MQYSEELYTYFNRIPRDTELDALLRKEIAEVLILGFDCGSFMYYYRRGKAQGACERWQEQHNKVIDEAAITEIALENQISPYGLKHAILRCNLPFVPRET